MTEYRRGVTREEIDSLPPGIIDKFNYVYAICIAPEPEFNMFSLDGFDRREWWYVVGRFDTKQIIHVNRQVKATDYLLLPSGITTLTDALRKGFSSEDIAIAVLESPNSGSVSRKAA